MGRLCGSTAAEHPLVRLEVAGGELEALLAPWLKAKMGRDSCPALRGSKQPELQLL